MATILLILLTSSTSQGAKFTKAEVTRIVNDVRLLTGTKNSRPAAKGSIVSGDTAVRTGQKSRAQMDFPDASIVRLGANSVFSFMQGQRDVDLEKGTLLMQVPKALGKTKIRTSSISAAITGTTILIDYVPPIRNAAGEIIKPGTFKAIVIEGSLELELDGIPGQTLNLKAGEMTAFSTDIKVLPKKFIIDLERLIKTSKLIEGGMGPLPHRPLMIREVEIQNQKKKDGQLVEVSTSRNHRRVNNLPGSEGGDIDNARRVDNARRIAPPIQLPERPDRP